MKMGCAHPKQLITPSDLLITDFANFIYCLHYSYLTFSRHLCTVFEWILNISNASFSYL